MCVYIHFDTYLCVYICLQGPKFGTYSDWGF